MKPKNHDLISHSEYITLKNACLQDFKALGKENITELIHYHQTHKYLFMTFTPKHLKVLGSVIANLKHQSPDSVYELYLKELLTLLENCPSKGNRINTLHHMFGYFKKALSDHEKEQFLKLLESYRNDFIEFRVPLSKLHDFVKIHHQSYLKTQCIFDYI